MEVFQAGGILAFGHARTFKKKNLLQERENPKKHNRASLNRDKDIMDRKNLI